MKTNAIIKKNALTGFTLIELLISLAIIGMLSSVILLNISNIKMKQRDTQRLSNMKELLTALNLYQNQSGQYPVYDGIITGDDAMSLALETEAAISSTPVDPLYTSPSSTYSYQYRSENGLDFVITFCLETDGIIGYNQDCENTIKP